MKKESWCQGDPRKEELEDLYRQCREIDAERKRLLREARELGLEMVKDFFELEEGKTIVRSTIPPLDPREYLVQGVLANITGPKPCVDGVYRLPNGEWDTMSIYLGTNWEVVK